MADRITNVSNAYETTLLDAVTPTDTTLNVGSTAGSPGVPFFIVIEPDDDDNREVVLVDGSKTATSFTLTASSQRGLDGTTAVAHSAGAVVGIYPVAAHWQDINDRVDVAKADISTVSDDLASHEGAADPHPQYQLESGVVAVNATARRGKSASQTIAAGIATVVTFDTAVHTDSELSTYLSWDGTNHRYDVLADCTIDLAVGFTWLIQANGGVVGIRVRHNTATFVQQGYGFPADSLSSPIDHAVSTGPFRVVNGDTLSIQAVLEDTGGDLDLSSFRTFLAVNVLRAN